jgi:hypothetical protein
MSSSESDLGRDFAAALYLTEALPLLGFCLGCSSNFVDFDSGQFLQHNPIPPAVQTYLYLFTQGRRGRGGVEPERRGEEQKGKVQITKLGRKYQHD